MDELTLDDWQRLIAFNLEGTFLGCHTVAPVMKRQKSGKIVNISSIAGHGTSASSSSAYAAAKGGIIAFTTKLAHELGPHGITVNAIAPSMTLTERIRPRWEQRTAEEQAREITRTPLRRMAEARDQARVICFLASSDADFVTGVTIDVTEGSRPHWAEPRHSAGSGNAFIIVPARRRSGMDGPAFCPRLFDQGRRSSRGRSVASHGYQALPHAPIARW